MIRALGGGMYLMGAIVMAYNLVRTALGHGAAAGVVEPAPMTAAKLQPAE